MQADVLVLDHDAAGLETILDVEILGQILRWRVQPLAQVGFLAVRREGDAVHRADVDAGIAFDAKLRRKYGLHVAVQAAAGFREGELVIEAKLDLGLDILERDHLVAVRHLVALVERDLVVVAPFVDAHLLAHDLDRRSRPVGDVLAVEHLVDRDGGLMAVRDGPDDVLRAKCRVATEEDFRMCGCHGRGVDLRHVPLIELDADVALDPGERVLLSDRNQHIVAGEVLVRLAGRNELAPPLDVVLRLHLLKGDAGELAALVREFLRHEEIMDRNSLVHGVFLFPGRRLHFLEAGAHDNVDLLAAEAARGPATVHRGIAAAENDDALADLVDMAERDGREPVDSDVNVLGRILAAGYVEVAPARSAGADEDRIPVSGEKGLHAVDALAGLKLDAEVKDVAALLVDDSVGQAEFRNLRAHHAAGFWILVEDHAVV